MSSLVFFERTLELNPNLRARGPSLLTASAGSRGLTRWDDCTSTVGLEGDEFRTEARMPRSSVRTVGRQRRRA